MKKIIFLLCISFSLSAIASFSGEVVLVKGKVSYRGKKVNKGDVLQGKGVLKTGSKAIVRIKFKKGLFTAGPNSKSELGWAKASERVGLISGTVRWITKKYSNNEAKKPVFSSSLASFGIRGTNFIIITNSLLTETEIVVFDGRVDFQNKKIAKDKKTIGKNQWGGIGGRYGESIGKILTLSNKQIKGLSGLLPAD